MKTVYELRYEEMITAAILANEDPVCSRLDLFMDFHRNSSVYYEFLCSALFDLACRKTSDSLWITQSGRPYLAVKAQSEGDCFLLSCRQVPEFQDDLEDQIEAALSALGRIAKYFEKGLDFVSTM